MGTTVMVMTCLMDFRISLWREYLIVPLLISFFFVESSNVSLHFLLAVERVNVVYERWCDEARGREGTLQLNNEFLAFLFSEDKMQKAPIYETLAMFY